MAGSWPPRIVIVPIQGKNIVDADDLLGDYKFINLGKDINRSAKQSVYISLNADHTISGEVTGQYRRYLAEPNRITIRLDGIASRSKACSQWQWNEAAEPLRRCSRRSRAGRFDLGLEAREADDAPGARGCCGEPELAKSIKDSSLELPTRGTRGATHRLELER